MIEQALKKAIPSQLNSFRKLTPGHDPYYFTSWTAEGNTSILRYWFWNKTKTKKNNKRVFINEVEELLNYLLGAKNITRSDFQKYCPRTLGDGPCGFAVTLRILEYFHIIEFADGEYIVKSTEKIHDLLGDQK